MGKQLEARDNVFALDVMLVHTLSSQWNSLTRNMEKKGNLESFLRILDFSSSEIKELYITGDEDIICAVKERLDNELTLEENPSKSNFSQQNDFFRTLHDNYNFNKENPSLSNKSNLKLFKTFDLIERADKATGLPRKWFVYFYSNIENIENEKMLDACEKRSIPIINIEEIENKFETFSELPDTLKKNQSIEPINFFKSLSKKSKFFIVYDRYLFSSRILRQDQLFGFIRKKISEPLSEDEKKINNYIDNPENETFKISEDENYENHIDKSTFDAINHNILFFLRAMDSFETENKNCMLIACGCGAIMELGKAELNAYFSLIDKRIEQIGIPTDDHENCELIDLNLIKKFKNSFLIWPMGKNRNTKKPFFYYGSKTNLGHNRIVLNDYALMEWGDGKNAFYRNNHSLNSWNSTGLQNISSKTLFNVKYKKRKWKKDVKNDGGYTHHQESLIDFCSDFSDDVLPKCKEF